MNKKEVINELKKISKTLCKSPSRRDIPSRLNEECIRLFGSFNNAKLAARLRIRRRNYNPLTKKSFLFDKKLVRICSYIIFDGHLYKDLTGFSFYSNIKRELEKIRKDTYNKFNLNLPKIVKGVGHGKKVLKYNYFNSITCNFLDSIGVPKGDKVLTKFNVPSWIKQNKEFAKEYLKIAYLCEGSWKEKRPNPRISINTNKSEEILENGISFMNDLRQMLEMFGIESTKVSITKGNLRKDGIVTRMLRFRIITKCNNNFIKEIGWLK